MAVHQMQRDVVQMQARLETTDELEYRTNKRKRAAAANPDDTGDPTVWQKPIPWSVSAFLDRGRIALVMLEWSC